ncbi:MAG: undecaprenyl-phosphomannose:protein mannosyltransferase [Hyphomicrobiales bacterium]|nr:undecaprenyl-phosphomannose:protein mannosyltransferase [Hyphomicrobiales bacterium]
MPRAGLLVLGVAVALVTTLIEAFGLNGSSARGMAGAARTSRLTSGLASLRRIPKATQFLAVSFFVTSLFALELRVDVVPNAFGFLELLLPVMLAAILFDASAGLFCAVLTVAFAFKALVPPRYPAILDLTSFTGSLISFALVSVSMALFFSFRVSRLMRAAGLPDEWALLKTEFRLLASRCASSGTRVLQSCRRHIFLVALVLLHALFWSLFASVSSGRGLHTDSLEAYGWGREFVFGYYKHPPFWAWVAGLWFTVFPKTDFAFLFLSELNGTLGLLGSWALMGRFCDNRMRALGVLLLMLTPFYQFNAERFNANTILLSIWPWTLYFFVRSMETRRSIDAVLCGVLAGCALLSKYFGVVLISTCFFASLTHEDRRNYYRSAAPYLTVIITGLVFAPHVVWLFRDGFQPFVYLSTKIDLADRAISNRYFDFVAGNAAFFILPAAILIASRWKQNGISKPEIAQRNGPSFMNVLALAPFVLTLVAGAVGHAGLGIPFAVPIFSLVPLCLIAVIKPKLERAAGLTRTLLISVIVGAALASPFLPAAFLRWGGIHYEEPRDEIAAEALKIWETETHAPLRFVAGGRDYALAATFQSADKVSEFNGFNQRWSPWVTTEQLHQLGLLAICRAEDHECKRQAAGYETAESKRVETRIRRRIGTVEGRDWDFTIFVIPPARSAAAN